MAGRQATTSIIPGEYALSVGDPGYEHPKRWKYVNLLDISDLATGHTPSRKFPEYWDGDIPWMSVGDARKVDGKEIIETKEYTNLLGIENSAAVLLPKDTVCLSRTASIGYSVRLGREMATSQGFVNFICSPLILPKFLQNLFLAERLFLYRISEGTAHTTIYYPEVKAFNVALPTLPEQQRIVAKLDDLFGHLDQVKTRLEKIPDLLKNFRQSILTQAVTGKLTEEWRSTNKHKPPIDSLRKERQDYYEKELLVWENNTNKWNPSSGLKKPAKPRLIKESTEIKEEEIDKFNTIPLEWEWMRLSDLVVNYNNDIVDGPFGSNLKSDEYQNEGRPILRIQNIKPNRFIYKNFMFVKQEKYESLKRHQYKPKDIIVTKLGEPLGLACRVPEDFESGVIVADLIRISPSSKNINYDWLTYLINSDIIQNQFKAITKGTTRARMNLSIMRGVVTPLCSKEEQIEIVKRVESIFTKADAIEAKYNALKAQIDSLPQAILAKAFKGELVEQLPTDGNAADLLEEIQKLKAETQPKGKKKKSK